MSKQTCKVDMPWGLCGEPATYVLRAPGYEDLWVCEGHHAEAEALEEKLREDPELAEEFKKAVNEAIKESEEKDPTRGL